MHFVAALDRVPGMRCVLALQENVVTGAADGYFRITGKPAATLLHCGPGLANGLANLHNARRARSGIVNIVGDQATYHRPLDAPLTADVEGWARPVSAWVRTSTSADKVGGDAAAAVQAARIAPGNIATLILPSDSSWDDGGVVGTPLPVPSAAPADPHAVRNAARVLREKKNVLILLGGEAVHEPSQRLLWRIAAMTGAQLMTEGSNARTERGRGRLPLERVPYANEPAVKALAPLRAHHPGQRAAADRLLRLSGQAEPLPPRRRRAARADARRAGRRDRACRRWSTSSARRRLRFPTTARARDAARQADARERSRPRSRRCCRRAP